MSVFQPLPTRTVPGSARLFSISRFGFLSRRRRRVRFGCVFSLVLFLLSGSPCAAQVLRFEDASQVDVPGRFVYSPQTRGSLRNQSARPVAKAGVKLPTDLQPGDSFTVEAFVRPAADLKLQPRGFSVAIGCGGKDGLKVGVYRSRPPHSYHWFQAHVYTAGRKVQLSRNSYGGLSMVRGETPWRHVAFTWDAKTKAVAFYLDYQLQSSAVLEQTPSWDLSTLTAGDMPKGARREPFDGSIDECRCTAKALQPWEFLRASDVELADVDFTPEKHPAFPADYGHVDVKLHYGAIGDGKHDDTAAIRRAFAENENRVPLEYKTVYFPAGEYLITDSIRFSRFMVVRGAGAGKTVIRLADKAKGYQTPDVPKPAFAVGYDWPYVGRTRRQRAGNAIGSYIFDLSIHTGSGNPSALGLDFHCNNLGCIENVNIRSGDGAGMVGLDFKRGWPGPCLMKNIEIEGFDYGISAAHREYSLVFSGIRLQNQRVAAIENGGNVLSMENVTSNNKAPAVINRGGGLVVLINSQLNGGDAANTAIQSTNASVYLRDVKVAGYGRTLHETRVDKEKQETTLASHADPQIEEYFTGPQQQMFDDGGKGSLKLPVKQTPVIPLPPASQWENVRNHASLVKEGDWSDAIQAAIDTGKPLVYFPPGERYRIDQDVIIRGSVRTLMGSSPKLKVESGMPGAPENGPAFVLDKTLPQVQFHMLTTAHIRHDSPTTLIVRHCNAEHISAAASCGELYIEDSGGKFRFNQHQRVWARQLNPETKGVPEVINNGGTLWVLGMKTEYLSTKIENRNGARTELLGGLMYPVHAVKDETLPMFINHNSDISLVHGVSVYKKNHKIYLQDTQGNATRNSLQWDWVSGRPLTNLYRSTRPRK